MLLSSGTSSSASPRPYLSPLLDATPPRVLPPVTTAIVTGSGAVALGASKSLLGTRPVRRARLSARVLAPLRAAKAPMDVPPLIAKEVADQFTEVGHRLADAAGDVIRKYFRKSFDILDKDDLSPVTIADREAEEAMVSIIWDNFPSHAIFGEENGWRCREKSSDYVWVLDPIDGTKSFITGKPLFGTLISLLHQGKPILGIIDQPVLRERWLGIRGKKTTLNGQEVSTRSCSKMSEAYMYTTSPHLFNGEAVASFERVRNKVKVPLYGCDCYAYALLSCGFVDLVVESGLKPYDFLALVPVIQGAGGVITDWAGEELHWQATPQSRATSFNVVAAGDAHLHQQALDVLQWR